MPFERGEILFSKHFMAVSYTHLDVYKRQIAGTIRNAVNQMQLVNDWEQKKATGDVVKKQEGMTVTSQEESMIPVSYTHLDVYKRQVYRGYRRNTAAYI